MVAYTWNFRARARRDGRSSSRAEQSCGSLQIHPVRPETPPPWRDGIAAPSKPSEIIL